jgi:DNA-binding MarR family transcriptional regulator
MSLQQTGVKMTRHEHQVFTWLLSKASASRRTKCSARTLALKFNFTDAYAGRLLKRMVDDELLEILRKGTGQRANLYRLENIDLSAILLPRKKRQRIPSLFIEDLPATKKTPLGGFMPRSTSLTGAGATSGIDNIVRMVRQPTMAVIPSMRSPFTRFSKKMHDPSQWNAQDIVCYYALLFKHEYSTLPAIDWKMDTVAGSNLLKKFSGNAGDVKRYLQLAFGLSKSSFTPHGLGTYTQAWVINQAIGKWDSEEIVGDYPDRDVLADVV